MPTVRSAEPEITACNVSPPPEVLKISRTRPYFLKMPARCPSRGAWTAHSPSCPIATLSVYWADVPDPATARYPASTSDNSQRRLRMGALMVVSLRPPVTDTAFFLLLISRAVGFG